MKYSGPETTPKILVVDDRPENLMAIKYALVGLDADIITAGSGNEALSLSLASDFAVVLLDVQMPEMDGFEVATLLRENEGGEDQPIIFVSAYCGDRAHLSQGYSVGAVDYLTKPIDPVILRSKVSIFLELNRSRKQLEEQNAQLQEFAQLAAHDLKAPLRAIRSFSEFLAEDMEAGNAEDVQRSLNEIVGGVERMNRLIEGMLDFARAGRTEEVQCQVDMNDVMKEVKALLSAPLEESGAQIAISDLPVVLGSKGRLIQLFQNLVGNAVKFRGERPLVVKLDCKSDSGRWSFRVQDNGIGIGEEDREKIFAPLKRLHGASEYDGAGLGLASCQKIVECYGGEIWAEANQEEPGSAFCFTLPKAA